MDDRLIPSHRQRAALLALVFASGVCLAMLASRAVFARNSDLGFYPWNLVLAWIPFLLARRIYALRAWCCGFSFCQMRPTSSPISCI